MTRSGEVTASAVVSAVPAQAFAKIFSEAAPRAAAVASAIRYLPMTTVSVAWRAEQVPNAMAGTGYITSAPEPGGLSACTWTSSKIPSRVPPGIVLVRGYCRSSDRQYSETAVRRDSAETLGIEGSPLFTRSFSWRYALPQYEPAHHKIPERIEGELRSLDRVAIAGAAFHGVGVGDCITSGERAADFVAARLKGTLSGRAP